MLLPPIVIAPKYFAGEVEFGTISQVNVQKIVRVQCWYVTRMGIGWVCIFSGVFFAKCTSDEVSTGDQLTNHAYCCIRCCIG